MKKSAPLTCSAASEGFPSDLREPGLFGPLPSVSKTLTPSASSANTGPKSQYTTMSEPSTQMDLEELTSSVAGSLASLGVSLGSSEAQKMTAISGQRWLPWLKSYGLTGSLAKTCEVLLTSHWGSSAAFLTWRGLGTAPSHLLFQLAPSMPRTEGTECGLLPTPRNCSAMAAENIQNRAADKFPNLESVVARSLWPPPTTPTGGGERSGDRAGTGNLHYMARSGQLWPTPQARDRKDGKTPKPHGNHSPSLPVAVSTVKMYPTPDVGAAKGRGQSSAENRHRLGGSLNPTWVEWLMGFPLGWTDLNALETPSARKSLSKSDGQSWKDNDDDLS